MKSALLYSILFFYGTILCAQDPYAPAVGESGTTAMHKDSAAFVAWASQVELQRGWQDIANKNLGKTSVGTAVEARGKADGSVVSLGDSGIAILQFESYIYDGEGPDFAVFENAFKNRNGGDFLEFAFVEVSSDGENFFRFPAHSLTDTSKSVGSFGAVDPRKVNNLAGKYYGNYGTPFDLAEMKGISGLDIQRVSHIKIIDVIGTRLSNFSSKDTANRVVVDPYPTPFPSGGFDLDAVAAIHHGTVGLTSYSNNSALKLYPNPTFDKVNIPREWRGAELKIYNYSGKLLERRASVKMELDVSNFREGVYILCLEKGARRASTKLIKR